MAVHHRPAVPLSGRTDPDDGPLARRVFECIGTSGDHALLGFCCDAGVQRNRGRAGAKGGPTAIRHALAALAAPAGMPSVADLGDVVVDGDGLEAGQRLLGDHVSASLAQHTRLVVLGGGHETALGTYTGLRAAFPERRIGVINLDAHLDIRRPGATGSSSGTPFHEIHDLDPDGFDYLCIGVAQASNTEALFRRAADWGVQLCFDQQLLEHPHAADAAIGAMAQRNDVVYLSIDIDVLPHYQAPGVSAPATRGVPLHTIERLVDVVLEACESHACVLPVADIVELAPPHDSQGVTARVAALLALRLLDAGD